MHVGNQDFLDYLKLKYPSYFTAARVLELGALNICGSVRSRFEHCDYVGVDIVDGMDVDVIMPAADTNFVIAPKFDTLIAFSLFEHDPGWRLSLANNLRWLRPDGMVFLSWGAEGNQHHAPDPFAPVPVAEFMAHAATLPILVLEMFFEAQRFTPDCPGCFDVVAVKIA